jgi:hypothetical protein
MIEKTEVESLLNSWRQKKSEYESNAKYFTKQQTGYYGKMAEAERDVAEQIVKDLESLLLKSK